MTATFTAADTSPGVLYLGHDVWVRLRLPGAPSTHRRYARIGSVASASQRFAAALAQPPAHRIRIRGPEPVHPTSLRGASTAPPRWWHPGLAPSEERADWVRALRPSTAGPPAAHVMPARGLPRAARSVPDEKTWTPGGIVSGLVAQVAAVRRHTEVAAAGPMLTSHDRAKLAASEAARPRVDPPAPAAPSGRPASRPTGGHDPPTLGQHRVGAPPPSPTAPSWQPARPSRLAALKPRAVSQRPTDPSGWRELVPGRAATTTKTPDRSFFSVAAGFDRFASKTRTRDARLDRMTQPSLEMRPATSVAAAPTAPVAVPITASATPLPTSRWQELAPGRLRGPAIAPKRGFLSVAVGLDRFASVTRGRDSALERATGRSSRLTPAQSVATAPARPVAVPVRAPSDTDADVTATPRIGSHRLAAVAQVSPTTGSGVTLGAHRRPSPPPPTPASPNPPVAPKDTVDAPVASVPGRSSVITLAATRSLATSRGDAEVIKPATAIVTAMAGPRMLIGGQRLTGGAGGPVGTPDKGATDGVVRRSPGRPNTSTWTFASPASRATPMPIVTPAPSALSRLAGSVRDAGGPVGRLGRELSAAAERKRDATATELTVAARSAKDTTARSVDRLARAFGAATDIRPGTMTPATAPPSGPVRLPGSVLSYAPGTEPGAPPAPVLTRPRRDADAALFRFLPAPPPMAPSRPSTGRTQQAASKAAPATSSSSLFGRMAPGPDGGLRRSLLDVTADLFAKAERTRTEPTGAAMSPDARDLVRTAGPSVRPRPEPSVLTDARLMQELVDRVVERIEDKVVDELERRGRRYNPGVF